MAVISTLLHYDELLSGSDQFQVQNDGVARDA